ncbi:putative alpha beta-hydrolase [Lyophyllum shimeji]|uniref:Alpha beta-hydrolase n=1 Tax=Lyophyllum shimeji TaxID=47721 RepID=A0A9P3PIM7_LYOSH|nr:putative alpha beta-hydrolase [Lyophyllum shimeji]
MNTDFYKTLTTTRGFVYRYYHLPAQDPSLPALLFLHGFPTTSSVWEKQIAFFSKHGFRLLVPDMLGFGETSKPTNPEAYRPSLVCEDILDILKAEGVDKVVAIGHDIGSKIVSRLANFHETRFLGYAFLAVPYSPPRPRHTMEYTVHATKRMCGYELVGHTLFFAGDDATDIIGRQLDSFYCAMFPADPKMWVTEVAPIGALKAWLEANKTTALPPYLSAKHKEMWCDLFLRNGFAAPLSWFKLLRQAIVSGVNAADDKAIPLENYVIKRPVFFAAARHDYISRSVLGIAMTNHNCQNASVREFNAGHWLMLSHAGEVNAALFNWIMDLV